MGGGIADVKNRFRKGAMLVLVLVLGAAPCLPQAPTALQPEEYAVYSALLRHGLPADAPRVILASQTFVQGESLRLVSADRQVLITDLGLPGSVVDDFIAANAEQVPISRAIEIPVPYELLDNAAINALFSGQGWAGFYSRFPGAQGVVRLSRIGFDESFRHALVIAEQICGTECGSGRLVYLNREDSGIWRTVAGDLMWMAGPPPVEDAVAKDSQ
jgi:hypothetical protein